MENDECYFQRIRSFPKRVSQTNRYPPLQQPLGRAHIWEIMLSSTCHYCSPQALIFQKYIVYSDVFRYICYDSSPFLLFSLPLSLFMDRYLSCVFGTQGLMYPDTICFLLFFCIIYLYEINKGQVSFFRYIRTYSFIAHYIVRWNRVFPSFFIVWYK